MSCETCTGTGRVLRPHECDECRQCSTRIGHDVDTACPDCDGVAIVCNADETGCTADDGEPCPTCRAERERDAEHWLRAYRRAPLSERDPKEYARQMVDAGRGHLLMPEQRGDL